MHKADGLHVRLRSSKTHQEGQAQVKGLPFGGDLITCPPCAYIRWRHVLHAWDASPGGWRPRASASAQRDLPRTLTHILLPAGHR